MPGALKYWRRSISLPQGGLDPRITHYINEVGFKGLFCILDLVVDYAWINALVERWHLETCTFQLHHGEMGITLR